MKHTPGSTWQQQELRKTLSKTEPDKIKDELLKALTDLVEWVENKEVNETPGFAFSQAKAAIKKATGE